MRPLFTAMSTLGATLLRFQKSETSDEIALSLQQDVPLYNEWEHYGAELRDEQVLLPEARDITTADLYQQLANCGAEPVLDAILAELKRDQHHQLCIRCDRESGSLFVQSWHSAVLAPNRDAHALYMGGLRRESIDHQEFESIRSTLQHARTMSHKNAFANIPYDGCKLTVIADPLAGDCAFYGWVGFCINQSRAIAAPELGIGPEEADVLCNQFTPHVVGGILSTLGPTSWSTAEGLIAAGSAALQHIGFDSFYRNRIVAVQGIGEVGSKVAELALERGANVILTDTVKGRVDAFMEQHPHFTAHMKFAPSETFLTTECDLLMPCATAHVISPSDVNSLQCRILLAVANDELAVHTIEEELEIADQLEEAGILYQVAWVHNIGGVTQAVTEYEAKTGASLEDLMKEVASKVHQTTKANLSEAASAGISPTRHAYQITLKRLYENQNAE